MAYTPTNWENGKTPLNETNLNKIEQGIVDLDNAVTSKEVTGISLPSKATTNIATVTLPAGTYLAVGYGEMGVGTSSVFALELVAGGSVVARTKNISMQYGGGGNVCAVFTLTASTTVTLTAYSYHSSEVVTGKCYLHAIKLR